MRTNQEFKDAALASLQDNWTSIVLAAIICLLILGGVSIIPRVGDLIYIFVGLPLAFGWSIAVLRFVRGEKQEVVSNMFDVFKDYKRFLGTSLLQMLFICLWTLLLIVPGIMKSYSYAMTPFLMHDNPNLSYMEALKKSEQMMYGHRWDLFMLHLSFIGWILLSCITFGLGFFFLMPYMGTATVEFYNDLKSETVEPTFAKAE